MTEAELLLFAEGVARQRAIVEGLRMGACPQTFEARIKADARFMVENDKLRILEDGYRAALRQVEWSPK